MARADNETPDKRLDRVLGNLLRAGVAVSALIVLGGGALYLARHGSEPRDYRVFRGEPAELRHPAGVVRAALEGDDRSVIALGLLVLIATPIGRVVFSAVAFVRQRDYTYVGLTACVLAILMYSLVGG